METETLIAIFLAFVSATLVFNTFLIWFAYKAFANVTMKVTETVREIEASGDTRRWLDSMLSASEHAVALTETTKRKLSEFDPALQDMHAQFGFLLAQIDTKTERSAADVSGNAERIRDAVGELAEKFAVAAAGVQGVLSLVTPPRENAVE